MCLKSIWKCCCSNGVDSQCQNWAIKWHQVPEKMILVTLCERCLYLSSHLPGSSTCKWAVLVNCFPYHWDYITYFRDILQCTGGFFVISVKLWSLLAVFKLCMWKKKKKGTVYTVPDSGVSSWTAVPCPPKSDHAAFCLLLLYWLSASWSLIGFFNYS